ncbi:hypothetical protein [Beijerinckia sp. L45]|uniref:hypothetical protein n=1 Tax=Beijerinckia sp. L45 TaxID=1641855 RepID=UPI00131CFB99|nr:hypothetical protein [Beijerinckia sp. L45]
MFIKTLSTAAVVLPLLVAQGAYAQTKPCVGAQAAQSFDRGTDPRAGGEKPAFGAQAAQSFDRGTDPRAGGEKPAFGAQTAQSFDRGTDPRAEGCK